MKICLKLLQLGIVLIFGTAMTAQTNDSWNGDDSETENLTIQSIKGKIVDADTKLGLEYATVTLFQRSDSLMVTGSITDAEGFFKIDAKVGNYFAKAEFISYNSKTIPGIVIDESKNVFDLGLIELEVNTAVLDVVEVRAEKSQMQIALDNATQSFDAYLWTKDKSALSGTATLADRAFGFPAARVPRDKEAR